MTILKRRVNVTSWALLGACLPMAVLAARAWEPPQSAERPQSVTEISPIEDEATALSGPAGITPLSRLVDTRERPLFHVSRRPVPEALQSASPPPEEGAEAFRLVGVTVAGDTKVALLRRVSDGRVLRVREGQRIGAWRIVAIGADRLSLRGEGGTRELRLRFDRVGRSSPERRPADSFRPAAVEASESSVEDGDGAS